MTRTERSAERSVLDAINRSLVEAGALPLLEDNRAPLTVPAVVVSPARTQVTVARVAAGPRSRRRVLRMGATVRRVAMVAVAVAGYALGRHHGPLLAYGFALVAGVAISELGLLTGRA